MGESTEIIAKEYDISRESQDLLALDSHINASKAYDAGFYDELVIPFEGVSKDNIIRSDSTIEKLSSLKTVFDKGPDATMTDNHNSLCRYLQWP